MECWVLKQGKKGVWISFLKNSWKIFNNEDFGFDIIEKGQILSPFSWIMGRENRPWTRGLKNRFWSNIMLKLTHKISFYIKYEVIKHKQKTFLAALC